MADLSKPKLADALRDQETDAPGASPAPDHAHRDFDPAAVHQHNAEVNHGLKDRDQRLVEIGRADQTKGRG